MAYEIIWTPSATRSLADLLIYLETEWSIKIAEGFVQELQEQILLIQAYPEIGIQSSKDKLVRRVLITRHNALYYLVENDKIIIANIFDTRSSSYNY